MDIYELTRKIFEQCLEVTKKISETDAEILQRLEALEKQAAANKRPKIMEAAPVEAAPVEAKPVEAKPVEAKPVAPVDIDIDFGDESADDDDIDFTYVQTTFFETLETLKTWVGSENSKKLAKKILDKHTGGHPLSLKTLPEENWLKFLDDLEGLRMQIKAKVEASKND